MRQAWHDTYLRRKASREWKMFCWRLKPIPPLILGGAEGSGAFAPGRDFGRARRREGDGGQLRSKRFPEDTIVELNYLPTLHAEIALAQNNPFKAIESLQAAIPYEFGWPWAFPLYPPYVRGKAYLAAHRGSEAATEFAKIIDHRQIVVNQPIAALAHLQLGRAYAMQGDTAKAKAANQDFLTLWKNADLEIPILKQAKAEYSRLQQIVSP